MKFSKFLFLLFVLQFVFITAQGICISTVSLTATVKKATDEHFFSFLTTCESIEKTESEVLNKHILPTLIKARTVLPEYSYAICLWPTLHGKQHTVQSNEPVYLQIGKLTI